MATARRQGLRSRFLPASGSEEFFDLFEQHAERTREATELLAAHGAPGGRPREAGGAGETGRASRRRDHPLGHRPIHVIEWKEIYDYLENAIDRCEDVANVIEGGALEVLLILPPAPSARMLALVLLILVALARRSTMPSPFAGLVAAFLWDLITWHYGLPSSSSHALIAGLAGAGVAKAGPGVLVPAGVLKMVVFIVVSPLIGFVLGATLMLAMRLSAVRWGVARSVVWAWIITIPCTAAISAAVCLPFRLP